MTTAGRFRKRYGGKENHEQRAGESLRAPGSGGPHLRLLDAGGGTSTRRWTPRSNPIPSSFPPPNITGQLHMGHAWDETLQDILIRWKRMQGYSALWLPGTDHASIATEAKIVEAMREEGRHQGGPGPGGLLRAGLGLEGQVRRPHSGAAQAPGLLLRLGPAALYHGRGLLQGGAPRVRQALQRGPDLPGGAHHQLVAPTARPPSPTRR